MTGKIEQVEVITSVQRRRRWSAEEKAACGPKQAKRTEPLGPHHALAFHGAGPGEPTTPEMGMRSFTVPRGVSAFSGHKSKAIMRFDLSKLSQIFIRNSSNSACPQYLLKIRLMNFCEITKKKSN
jgi:hypothetical protein